MNLKSLQALALASLIGLIGLSLGWELWFAPLKPSGSWLVAKSLPLLVPLFGVLRGRAYTFQWASMLILVYFAEGVVRALTDRGLSATLAGIEVVLALTFFCACLLYVRASRRTA